MSIFELNKTANNDRERAKAILENQTTAKLEAIIDADETNETVFDLAREVLDRREISGGIDASYFETFEHDNNEPIDSFNPVYA